MDSIRRQTDAMKNWNEINKPIHLNQFRSKQFKVQSFESEWDSTFKRKKRKKKNMSVMYDVRANWLAFPIDAHYLHKIDHLNWGEFSCWQKIN